MKPTLQQRQTDQPVLCAGNPAGCCPPRHTAAGQAKEREREGSIIHRPGPTLTLTIPVPPAAAAGSNKPNFKPQLFLTISITRQTEK